MCKKQCENECGLCKSARPICSVTGTPWTDEMMTPPDIEYKENVDTHVLSDENALELARLIKLKRTFEERWRHELVIDIDTVHNWLVGSNNCKYTSSMAAAKNVAKQVAEKVMQQALSTAIVNIKRDIEKLKRGEDV